MSTAGVGKAVLNGDRRRGRVPNGGWVSTSLWSLRVNPPNGYSNFRPCPFEGPAPARSWVGASSRVAHHFATILNKTSPASGGGGIQKWVLSGGTWRLRYIFN